MSARKGPSAKFLQSHASARLATSDAWRLFAYFSVPFEQEQINISTVIMVTVFVNN